MERKPKILAFAGSLRKGSYNKKLIKIASAGAKKAGALVTLIDLANFRVPLYDGDLEEEAGIPPLAKDLKKLMVEHDGFLLASPEYNSSISGVLKNAFDWVSRPEEGEPSLVAFTGKIAAIMSASPSYLGGLRGLVHLRAILGNLSVLVLPDQVTVPRAFEAFNNEGRLQDGTKEEKTLFLGTKLVDTVRKLL